MLPLRGVLLYVSVYYPGRCPWVDVMLPLRGVTRGFMYVPYPGRCPWVNVMLPLRGASRGLMYVALPRALPVG